MKMVPFDAKKVSYRLCKNQRIINEFVESGLDCAKIEGWTHKNAYIAQRGFTMTTRRMHLEDTVMAASQKGEVFLIRVDK